MVDSVIMEYSPRDAEERPLLQKSRSIGTTGRSSSSRSLREYLRRSSDSSESNVESPSSQLRDDENKQQLVEKARHAVLFSLFLTISAVGVAVTACAVCSDIDQFVFVGAIISCIFCFVVLYSYSECARLRKYPNQLMVHKSFIDLVLSMLYIVQYTLSASNSSFVLPSQTAAFSQGLLVAGEFWFCAMSVDLIQSVSNPFSSFSYNLNVYRLSSLMLGVVCAIVFFVTQAFSKNVSRFFWVLDPRFVVQQWLFYYAWVGFCMLVSLICFVYVHRRLGRGIEETFETRKKVLENGLIASVTYISWSSFVILLFTIASFPALQRLVPAVLVHWLLRLNAFTHAARGTVNLLVWFLTNGADILAMVFFRQRHRSVSDDWILENVDELLKPQLNLALRRQVIQMATKGIVDAVEHYLLLHQSIRTNQSFALDWDPKHRSTSVSSVDLDFRRFHAPRLRHMEEMHFEDAQPRIFATMRSLSGIDDNEYLRSFRATANERLSEGRSGAFVFNTINRKYLVKSMTRPERDFLISIMPAYLQYLKWNPSTLLPRFYGVHAMKMYGKMFYFVVMANIFPTREIIHRRYDIKGSWIDRNAPVCVLGEKYRCANCNKRFVFGGQEECASVVGEHYPDITLRDNDLKKRIKLPRDASHGLLKQIARDSDFLCGLGIMDYSLLIGMHYSQFKITGKRIPKKDVDGKIDVLSPTMSRSRISHQGSPKLLYRHNLESSYSKRQESSSHGDEEVEAPDGANVKHRYHAHFVSGPSAYYIGIIDILQRWTLGKQMERLYKVHVLQKNPRGISAVNPKQYAKRFQTKMCQLLYQPEDDDD
ncbi:Aste57867_21215 [Aphanomyces stellatus]|uniref:Aste57867_21215 protein n=1 Tax=Aphanomyces stellatus TaxID=120398 RepID=A0A485LGX9_9STRA|nr:hypothetical protein As57867_021147 [Aphanomyces stellatus]VFT97887.1 Aste57867_21215 [Aphanomyces stellatus]